MTFRTALRRADPREPAATALLEASHALMRALFPAETNHFLSIDALCAPDIRFFLAEGDRDALGCGALALRDGYGEIKSMFVAPEARGTGAGAAILNRIEDEARAAGLPCLRLETGDRLHAAHRLYLRCGFGFRGPFGAYSAAPESLFMEKPLT
ncbi:GNAT family N-acetyltransferase [Pikeienuella piscinae]|uniref:GNAT family N-acetyltransferase n=1 Tax=Pikeienuella piscinae TaxID=2748098 RepID=A0A7L5BYP6_9RHOB|nr:GNAT family N-acetyltransferase [Pikeienuella piscinae]QIE54729.1 GNAT family N-acetyltransferase [Pikeienuella piscinae]